MSPASSIAVVCTVAISCLPSGDLAAIGGNRLEALEGDRAGQYSIRINDQ
jgi:plasmid maintenance system killer protein